MPKRARRASTQEVLTELVERPPLNDGELGRRLRDVDRPDARREIVDRLFEGSAPREALDVLAAALLVIGVEGQEARLERIIADLERSRGQRWTALSLLFSASPPRAQRALMDLDPRDALKLTLQPAAEAVTDVLTDPSVGDNVAEALAALPPEVRADGMAFLEDARRGSGTPAVYAYRSLLQREGLDDLHRSALDVIVEEGGASAAAELTRLRDESSDPSLRRALQRALLRLGTRAIEATGPAPEVKGEARIGICDGQSAFIIVGCFDNADGTTTVADLCIRASGEVRDGFTAAGLDEGELEALFRKMRGSGLGDLARLSLSEAAAIVFAGVERTRRAGLSIPEDARPAVLLYERALSSGGGAPAPIAPPERGAVTLEEARDLLSLRWYESWFFDAGDLSAADVPLPPLRAGKPRARWIDAALAGLSQSEVVPRVTAMLAHMALWHRLRGEAERAALCAAASAEVAQSFRTSAFARAMLERSVRILQAAPGDVSGRLGDPETRRRIRLRLFSSVDEPRGKDLAALDLTEAALLVLSQLVEALPVSRRPREEDLLRAAGAMAAVFAQWVLSRRRGRPETLVARMEEAAATLVGPTPGELAGLVSQVLPALVSFIGEVCEQCPVACLTRPRADLADAFFSERHPSLG